MVAKRYVLNVTSLWIGWDKAGKVPKIQAKENHGLGARVRLSICCSSRGLGLDSQHPHGDIQWTVTPVLGDLGPSAPIDGRHSQAVHRHTYRPSSHHTQVFCLLILEEIL